MKKTLIIVDGSVAKIFLNTILDKYFSNNHYVIVAKDTCFVPSNIPSSFEFYTFDYTSEYRLSRLINSDITDIFIVLENNEEIIQTYALARNFSKKARIVLFLLQELRTPQMLSDTNLIMLDPDLIISNKFIERLPNVPLIPRSFGLGQGELMEINVPTGSIFAHRHIGSIQQKKWKIVGIYRRGELLLSSHYVIIQPNDNLLVAGDPKVLNDVYMQIKSDIGQFPLPFGKDIFLYIDMSLQPEKSIWHDIQNAIFLNQNLKSNKLFIRILNPCSFELLDRIKALESSDIDVKVDYANLNFEQMILKDAQKRPGLIIINYRIFAFRRNRKALFGLSIPVFKTGWEHIEKCKKSFVILGEDMGNDDNVASVMFDISKQLDLDIDVYDFDPDASYRNDIVQSYEDLSRIFRRKINIIQTDSTNPILYIQDSFVPYVHFIPFVPSISKIKIFSLISIDVHKIASLNNKNPQVFIPLPKEQK